MQKINWINGQAGGTPLSAENLNLMQDNIEDAIDEVNGKFSKIKLWEISGSGWEQSFTAQTINLASSDYDYLMIYYYRSPSNRVEAKCEIVEKGTTTELQWIDYLYNNARAWSRTAQVSEATVIFGNATINGETQNHTLIPYKIVGGKY